MLDVLAKMMVRSTRRPPGRRVGELGQLVDEVGQLVAPFTASDVDDDVGVAPLGQLFEQHGLAFAEAADDGGAAALGDRFDDVEHSLAGDEGLAVVAALR